MNEKKEYKEKQKREMGVEKAENKCGNKESKRYRSGTSSECSLVSCSVSPDVSVVPGVPERDRCHS